jgi:Family of unknown function (DUF6267)
MKIIHLLEAYDTSKARIDHPEDLVITAGSRGAGLAIDVLEQAGKNPAKMSVKPDGKPAIKWGKDSGGFAMGDKYMNPLPHSPEELAKLLQSRKGDSRDELAAMYAQLWPLFEASVGNINGYLFGDLMYSSTPEVDGTDFVFQPNTVEYRVAVNSNLGKRMARSQAGIVVHTFLPLGSTVGKHISDPSAVPGLNLNGPLLIMADSIPAGSKIATPNLSKLKSAISANSQAIDSFLDASALTTKKIKGMIPMMIKYVNERVRSRSFDGMAAGFIKYVDTAASGKMAEAIKQHIAENQNGYTAIWAIFQGLAAAKNAIVNQLDSTQGELRGSIGNEAGQEGYLVHTRNGPVKLVNRFKFSATHFGA